MFAVFEPQYNCGSRYHVVQEFNKGVYDYIIATDESGLIENDVEEEEDKDEDCESPANVAYIDFSSVA